MHRASWAFACVAPFAIWLLACGGESRSRDDGGATPLPPPPMAVDASIDREAPPLRDASRPDLGRCARDEIECDGVCSDLQNDPANCGVCGNICAGCTDSCIRGVCTAGCTGMGLQQCGACCVDTLNNPAHCGSCETVCPPDQVCVGGGCECPDPLILCDGHCANTQSDNDNCGACGNTCVSPADVCLGGVCACTCDPLTCCLTGCADLQNDPNNCGACGVVVPIGFICQGGMQVCPPGTQECDAVCVNLNDSANCGACGAICEGVCEVDVVAGSAHCEPAMLDGGAP